MLRSLRREFKEFVFRGNVIDLAVAVVIGTAFGKIVTSFVADLVMPLVGLALPSGDWRTFKIPLGGTNALNAGSFLGAVVDFLIIAGVIFLIMVKFLGSLIKHKKDAPAEPPPVTKTCGECLENIPLAARRCRACASVVAAVALFLLLPITAQAQVVDPKFSYVKPEEPVPAPAFTAQAKGGLLLTAGNSETRAGTAGITAAYKEGMDRVSTEAAVTYARSTYTTVTTPPANKMLTSLAEITETSQTTSNSWLAKARYDRFFTTNNAAYVSAQVFRDRPAGKDLLSGAQVGYSRQVIANQRHRLVAEVGYDFSYEKAVSPTAEGVQIHSGRAFVSESWSISSDTGITASVEMLTNLNKETKPAANYAEPGSFEDTRGVGKLGLTTTIWKNVSFGFGFTARYDHAPAPRPAPKGFSFDTTAFQPLAEEWDTTTEASLIVTFF